MLLRTEVRNAKSQKRSTWAWSSVQKAEAKVSRQVRIYQDARGALISLETSLESMQKYLLIQDKDLKMSGDIVEESRLGQRSETLPWLWRQDLVQKEDNEVMNEYMVLSVYRVNWIRAKARWTRWKEEVELVKNEMKWVLAWFKYQEDEWRVRGNHPEYGFKVYAEKQMAMWGEFQRNARERFSEAVRGLK
ncbi:hypothetical protein JAAARDRAFT_139425 [Jaapia argillacea MUCL 33604]|uniref:Uncharacterized protein n=1 Tax=Jaapia argillacea MUCL 33604 TaxID=933084 RepID=A0A067PDT0_9AGAM|nr:hypothetical protein JAAARDRAFT_139425 [Jaapia argillacea MUCL 33604]